MAGSSAIYGAGLLGDLNYDYNHDQWALELGRWLEVAKAASGNEIRVFRQSHMSARLQEAMDEIGSIFDQHFPGVSNEGDIRSIIRRVHGMTLDKYGASVLVVLCIGQCAWVWASYQFEGQRKLNDRLKPRWDVIDQHCPQLGLTTERLSHILRRQSVQSLSPLGTSRLLTQLSQPVKVLFMSSEPRNKGAIEFAQEYRELHEGISGARFPGSLHLDAVAGCRPRDIAAALDTFEPNILHFSGHGNNAGLCFEDDGGRMVEVSKKALARLLRTQKNLKLVVLSACYSREQAQEIANAVGLVIGTKGTLGNDVAIDFSREFYQALGYGRTFEGAFERARAALGLTGTPNVTLLKRRVEMQGYGYAGPHARSGPRFAPRRAYTGPCVSFR